MSWATLATAEAELVAPGADARVLFRRDDQAIVGVTGKHRGRFLQALMTQDMNADAAGNVARTCLCTAQGRLIAVATGVTTTDAIYLVTLASTAQPLIDGLMKYRVAERVKLAIDPDVTLLTSTGTALPDVEEAPSIATWTTESAAGTLHHRLAATDDMDALASAANEAGFTTLGAAAWHATRINHGIADVGVDVDDGSTPLELGMRDAVSYTKGCYLGQEAIAMMTYRGKLRRHLCWIRGDNVTVEDAAAFVAGAKLRNAQTGKRAGVLASGYIVNGTARGLAIINRRSFQPGAMLAIPRPAIPPAAGADPFVAQLIDATVADVFADEDA